MMRWCHCLISMRFCRLLDISRHGPRYPWQKYFFNVFAGSGRIFHLVFKTYFIVEIACVVAVVLLFFFSPLIGTTGAGGDFFFFSIAYIIRPCHVCLFFSCVLCGCRTSFVMPGLSPWWSRRSRRIKATQVWQSRPATPWLVWPSSTPPIR